MRDYLYETIGDRAEKEEEYLKAMEEGPWKTNFSFKLTGNTEGVNSKNTIYTIADPDYNEETDFVKTENDESSIIREVYAEKDEELTFILTFGTKSLGALKSGYSSYDIAKSIVEKYISTSFGDSHVICSEDEIDSEKSFEDYLEELACQ